jgi:protein required for attachment to host cells
MYRACIAVIDATRARLFTLDREFDGIATHEELTEQTDFVNPARHLRASELFSDSPGTSRAARGLHFAFDDHRDAHIDHMDAEFAHSVTAEIGRVVRDRAARRLVVCASPQMLGQLRAAELYQTGIVIDEVPHELAKLTAHQLRDQLAAYGVLPPRPPRPSITE